MGELLTVRFDYDSIENTNISGSPFDNSDIKIIAIGIDKIFDNYMNGYLGTKTKTYSEAAKAKKGGVL